MGSRVSAYCPVCGTTEPGPYLKSYKPDLVNKLNLLLGWFETHHGDGGRVQAMQIIEKHYPGVSKMFGADVFDSDALVIELRKKWMEMESIKDVRP
jgi:hypothetical protein